MLVALHDPGSSTEHLSCPILLRSGEESIGQLGEGNEEAGVVNPDQECGGGRTARRSPGRVGKLQQGLLPTHVESGELENGVPSSRH